MSLLKLLLGVYNINIEFPKKSRTSFAGMCKLRLNVCIWALLNDDDIEENDVNQRSKRSRETIIVCGF
jgi:hypothetical protein